MNPRRIRIVVAGAAAAVALVCAVVVVGSHVSIGHGSLGNLASGGAGGTGGGGSSPPKVTSIILDVSGIPGDIHVLTATTSSTASLTVATSDPNVGTLRQLQQWTSQGNMTQAVRTMYLHYSYSDGTTRQYTLSQSYVSGLSSSAATSSGTGTVTATLTSQSGAWS